MASLSRIVSMFVGLSVLLAGCGGRANVAYPLIDDVSFQVRTVKMEDNRYNAVGSRTLRGAEGMIDPAGETRKIMDAIETTMQQICSPRRAVLVAREVQPLVIAINTLFDCVKA